MYFIKAKKLFISVVIYIFYEDNAFIRPIVEKERFYVLFYVRIVPDNLFTNIRNIVSEVNI